ncbi:hypothetical protein GOC69_12280 [Sinorhizobium medicae]|nr:hypothetical protein [Sinorhizobium medicae]MDX0475221.1 hypothetical protein [Sinorhizobium medicae]
MSDILTKIVAHIVTCIYVFVIFCVPAALVSYFDFFGAASRSFVEIFITAASRSRQRT